MDTCVSTSICYSCIAMVFGGFLTCYIIDGWTLIPELFNEGYSLALSLEESVSAKS